MKSKDSSKSNKTDNSNSTPKKSKSDKRSAEVKVNRSKLKNENVKSPTKTFSPIFTAAQTPTQIQPKSSYEEKHHTSPPRRGTPDESYPEVDEALDDFKTMEDIVRRYEFSGEEEQKNHHPYPTDDVSEMTNPTFFSMSHTDQDYTARGTTNHRTPSESETSSLDQSESAAPLMDEKKWDNGFETAFTSDPFENSFFPQTIPDPPLAHVPSSDEEEDETTSDSCVALGRVDSSSLMTENEFTHPKSTLNNKKDNNSNTNATTKADKLLSQQAVLPINQKTSLENATTQPPTLEDVLTAMDHEDDAPRMDNLEAAAKDVMNRRTQQLPRENQNGLFLNVDDTEAISEMVETPKKSNYHTGGHKFSKKDRRQRSTKTNLEPKSSTVNRLHSMEDEEKIVDRNDESGGHTFSKKDRRQKSTKTNSEPKFSPVKRFQNEEVDENVVDRNHELHYYSTDFDKDHYQPTLTRSNQSSEKEDIPDAAPATKPSMHQLARERRSKRSKKKPKPERPKKIETAALVHQIDNYDDELDHPADELPSESALFGIQPNISPKISHSRTVSFDENQNYVNQQRTVNIRRFPNSFSDDEMTFTSASDASKLTNSSVSTFTVDGPSPIKRNQRTMQRAGVLTPTHSETMIRKVNKVAPPIQTRSVNQQLQSSRREEKARQSQTSRPTNSLLGSAVRLSQKSPRKGDLSNSAIQKPRKGTISSSKKVVSLDLIFLFL